MVVVQACQVLSIGLPSNDGKSMADAAASSQKVTADEKIIYVKRPHTVLLQAAVTG